MAAPIGNAGLVGRPTTIFEIMSGLARKHQSVNLGQGELWRSRCRAVTSGLLAVRVVCSLS